MISLTQGRDNKYLHGGLRWQRYYTTSGGMHGTVGVDEDAFIPVFTVFHGHGTIQMRDEAPYLQAGRDSCCGT